MTYPTKAWIILCLVILYTCGVWFSGAHTTDKKWQAKEVERKLLEAVTANAAWAERFTLQAQLATRDQQLADSQAMEAQKRTVVVVQKEVIYRDRIKNPDMSKCISDSGLLDLINYAYGLPSDTK